MAKRGQAKTRHSNYAVETARAGSVPPTVEVHATSESLTIVFSDEGLKPGRSVSELLRMGEAALPFAEAVARVLALIAPGKSRRTKYKDFQHGYLRFVSTLERPFAGISDVDGNHVLAFISWLREQVNPRNGEKLTTGNRIHKLGCLKDTLVMLARDYPGIDVGSIVPRSPWGTDDRPERSTEPLDDETLRKLVMQVESEVQMFVRCVDEHLPPHASDQPSVMTVAASLANRKLQKIITKYEHIPQKSVAKKDGLSLSIKRKGRPGAPAAFDVLMGPTSRQLHSVFMYLLLYTGFNEQPLRDLEVQDVESNDVMGLRRTTFTSAKLRALSTAQRTFVEDPNDVMSVHRVVAALKRWTEVLRSVAHPELRKKLFLFLPRNRTKDYPVGSFASKDPRGEIVFRNCISAMSKAVSDKYVGPRAIRANSAEFLQDLLNGDSRLVSLALGHKSAITTNANYKSATVRDNEEWWLAGVMGQRERHLYSKGKVDPRQNLSQSETTAATPGWTCIDNMTSPIEGQRHGRPCTAYPQCPKCPHSQPHPDSAYSLARTIQLFAKIEECVAVHGLALATQKYGDLLPYLTANQQRLNSPEVVKAAAAIRLSPIPELD